MFKDKTFNFAILFSTVWHLFWMSAIGIIVTPSVQTSNAYQEVDFLGPILEKTAFDLMVEEVKPQNETLYAKSTLFLDGIYLKPKGPGRKVLKEFFSDTILDRFSPLEGFVKDTKEVQLYVAENINPLYFKTTQKEASLLEGPAVEREIIFKPELLAVPRGLYSDAGEYHVKLKFFVSDGGMVYDAGPIVSSGYPEIDLRAIRFLKKWRFSPLSVIETERSAVWGIATVRIVVE